MSEFEKPVLVYLANGVQGGAVVQAALRQGRKVRAPVRHMPVFAVPGVTFVLGDLDDAASLRAASDGASHAVLQLPGGPLAQMLRRAQNALAAATAAGLSAVILKLSSASRAAPCAEASFIANHAVEQAVRLSGLPFAIVRPTMYLDNLLKPSVREDILRHGVFAPPIAADQKIAWTNADDCAGAAMALLANGCFGGDHRIAGAESLTGDMLAARISSALGRPVAYRAQPLADFARDVEAAMGPGMGELVTSKFRYFAAHPDEAEAILARPYAPQPGLGGFRPARVEDWVRRHREALLAG